MGNFYTVLVLSQIREKSVLEFPFMGIRGVGPVLVLEGKMFKLFMR